MDQGGLAATVAVWGVLLAGGDAWAQDAAPARPAPVVEGSLGWAGFGDEGIVHHTLLGAGVRYYVSRRVSSGPELQYMRGPDSDRDFIATGNLVVDLLAPTAYRRHRTTPYVIVGGGLFHHSDRFLTGTFTSTEGAFTAGVGVRGWTADRVFLAVDARLGWEAHLRLCRHGRHRIRALTPRGPHHRTNETPAGPKARRRLDLPADAVYRNRKRRPPQNW